MDDIELFPKASYPTISVIACEGKAYLLVDAVGNYPGPDKILLGVDIKNHKLPGFLSLAHQMSQGKFFPHQGKEYHFFTEIDKVPRPIDDLISGASSDDGARFIGRFSSEQRTLEISAEVMSNCGIFATTAMQRAVGFAQHPIIKWLLSF